MSRQKKDSKFNPPPSKRNTLTSSTTSRRLSEEIFIDIEDEKFSSQKKLQQDIDRIMRNIGNILKGLKTNNQSYLSRMAESWANRSLGFKIGIFLMVMIVLVAVAVFTDMLALLCLPVVFMFLYPGIGYVLSDHHDTHEDALTVAENGIMSLVKLWAKQVLDLEKRNEELKTNNEAMAKEIIGLHDNVNDLFAEKDRFKDKSEELGRLEISLKAQIEEIKKSKDELNTVFLTTKLLLEQRIASEAANNEAMTKQMDNLQLQLQEFESMKNNMQKALDDKQSKCTELASLVTQLTGINEQYVESQQDLVGKTDAFFNKNEEAFTSTLGMFSDTTNKLNQLVARQGMAVSELMRQAEGVGNTQVM